ncbi:HEPN domain-containing protein [Microcystis aeruginosa]|uniref:ApeA N-terminal domain 1-containing protein n=1 Tax=Microcystis aeruginosa TaxID=1126 RepID=UPI001882311E|nr:HEPN domain-containing protein [Microcystis aeruginosa]MBE8995473.1 hypothetical protein [Microcystis aeruginosa LEGE 91341]
MIDEFEREGYWWLPEHPEKRVIGKLSHKLNQRLVLNIDDTFNTLAPLLSWFPYGFKSQATLIYGKLIDGKFVSLFNCDIKETKTGENLVNLQVNPEYMLLYDIYFQNNYLLNKEDLNKFKKLKVDFSFLNEWVKISPLDIKNNENIVKITYERLPNIKVGVIRELELSIAFVPIYNLSYHNSADIKCRICLEIVNKNSSSLEDCKNLVIQFRDFLSFATYSSNQIVSVHARHDKTDNDNQYGTEITPIEIIWNERKPSKNSDYVHHWSKMLLTYDNIKDDLEKIFQNWIDKREKFKIVFQGLLINIRTPELYLEYQFLNIVQALEIYHKQTQKGKHKIEYMSQDSYQNGIYQKLREVIQNYPMKEDFKRFLDGKVKYLFKVEKNLKDRLRDIIDNISYLFVENNDDTKQSFADTFNSQDDSLFSRITKDQDLKDKFLKRVTEIRHNLTHPDKEIKIKNQELYDLLCTVTLILQTCLLIELEVATDTIKAIIKNRMRNQNEWLGEDKYN